MSAKLRIASISSEIAPFSKAGGLGDVSRSLPRALAKRGHDVLTVSPLHSVVNRDRFQLERIAKDVPITVQEGVVRRGSFWVARKDDGAPAYFIDHGKYFAMRRDIYGSKIENRRFWFFDAAVFALLEHLGFKPDIIQCHDWESGLIPCFLKRHFAKHELFRNTASVFTIHNLAFQFGHSWWKVPNELKDTGRGSLPAYTDHESVERINFAKRAILHADAINTVSPQYAKEILTANFGQDLHRILKHRENRLVGILNGIDYEDFNPATDPGLIEQYTVDTLDGKAANKRAVQRAFRLPMTDTVPLLAMVTRITEQKGFDLLLEMATPLLRLDLQILILGGGDRKYERLIQKLCDKYPKRVASHLQFDTKIATRIYAASDMLLMPSHFEPSGLGQMIALRYGSIPIVRATGGLVDSISNYNPRTKQGNGFVFRNYDARELLISMTRAVETYRYPEVWAALVQRSMRQSFSWELPAKKYIAFFRKTVRVRRS